MILRARVVVTVNGAPIRDGAVVTSGERITAVGPFREVRAEHRGDVTDLGEVVLLPGLINAHCHLDYTGLRGMIPRQKSFADWIVAINAERARLTDEDYRSAIAAGFSEARRFGTTSIANLTGFPRLIREIPTPLRTWWFAELIDIRRPGNAAAVVEEALLSMREARSALSNFGLAPHAPYTASAELYRQCENAAEREHLFLTTHLAESAEEMQMSFDLRGPLAHLLASISQDLFENDGRTPVAHLAKYCRLDGRWLLAHVNEIRDSDLELLRESNIVHCPRSHAYFGHSAFQFRKLRDCGANICLGTDSLASNHDLSMFAEMRALGRIHSIAPPELIAIATANGARALRRGSELGRIASGFLADLIAIPANDRPDIHEQIVAFSEDVPWLMVAGKVVSAQT